MASAFPDLCDIFIDAAWERNYHCKCSKGKCPYPWYWSFIGQTPVKRNCPTHPIVVGSKSFESILGSVSLRASLESLRFPSSTTRSQNISFMAQFWKNYKAERYLQLGDRRWHNETDAVQQRPLCWVTRRQHFSSGVKPCDDSEILNIRGVSPLSLPVLFRAVIPE